MGAVLEEVGRPEERFVGGAGVRRRLGMTDCGGQRREGRHRIWCERWHGNRRNAGDAENGIQQRAIFGAEARDFVALVGRFQIQACVRCGWTQFGARFDQSSLGPCVRLGETRPNRANCAADSGPPSSDPHFEKAVSPTGTLEVGYTMRSCQTLRPTLNASQTPASR